jgi:multidrug efflux pump subunit AcrA (membrane-fusion protein)
MTSLGVKLLLFLSLGAVFLHAAPEPEASKIPTVFILQAKAIPLFDRLTYPARLTPKVNAQILAESDGVVQKIEMPLGRPVRRNQRLMTLKHTDPIYDFALVSVLAPVKGVVSSIDVTEGTVVAKGQKLAAVTDPHQVRIVLEVASSDLSSVHPGLTADLRLPGQENAIHVRVTGISPFIDAATGTATCEMDLVGKGPETLPPGMMGRVVFRVREHKGYEIPESAVVYRGNQTYLRLVKDTKAKLSPVGLGQTRRGMVEILSGLEEDDAVVVRSSTYVAEGETVKTETAGAGEEGKL